MRAVLQFKSLRLLSLAGLALLISVAISTTVLVPQRMNAEESVDDPIGVVVAPGGSSSIYRGLKEISAVALMQLHANDSIRTTESSTCKVFLNDGTVITVGPSSEIRLAGIDFAWNKGRRQMELELVSGRARITIAEFLGAASEVKLSSPAAVFTSSSADIVASHDPDGEITQISLLQGNGMVRNLFAEGVGSEVPEHHTLAIAGEGAVSTPAMLAEADLDGLRATYKSIPAELQGEAGQFGELVNSVMADIFSSTARLNRRPNLPLYGPRSAMLDADRVGEEMAAKVPPQNGTLRIYWNFPAGSSLQQVSR